MSHAKAFPAPIKVGRHTASKPRAEAPCVSAWSIFFGLCGRWILTWCLAGGKSQVVSGGVLVGGLRHQRCDDDDSTNKPGGAAIT